MTKKIVHYYYGDRSPPQFPEIKLPEDLFVRVALYLRCVFNVASKMCQDVTTEPDIRKFLTVTFIARLYFCCHIA